MAERKFPTWATDTIVDIGNGDPNKADPGAPKQASGWGVEKPLLQSFNWLQNLFGHFVKANNQVAPKATGYEAEAGERVIMDNSGAAATLNLPTSPLDGQWVEVDAVGLFSVFPVFVEGGSNDIMVAADTNMELDMDGAVFRFWWDNTNSLWKIRIASTAGRV